MWEVSLDSRVSVTSFSSRAGVGLEREPEETKTTQPLAALSDLCPVLGPTVW